MARSAHFKQYSPCQVRNVRNGEVGVPYASLHFGDRTVPVTPHGTPVVGRQSPQYRSLTFMSWWFQQRRARKHIGHESVSPLDPRFAIACRGFLRGYLTFRTSMSTLLSSDPPPWPVADMSY